jgi:ribonuclease D
MTKETYPPTIAKEDVMELPILRYNGPVEIIKTKKAEEHALKELYQEKVLGFDTESRPSFKKGEQYPVCLLQLSTSKKAYLFRLNKNSLSKAVTDLLADESILKVGVAIADDIKGLQKLKQFKAGGFIEIADLAKDRSIKMLGLRNLAAIVLGKRITKGAKLSNWENDKLDKSQVTYAATDAFVGRELYLKFTE